MSVDGVGDMFRIDADGIDRELHRGDLRSDFGGGVPLSAPVDILLRGGDDIRPRPT